ncbi:MAG: outer membrane beta-barrel protein [Bacteroidales bacterium]
MKKIIAFFITGMMLMSFASVDAQVKFGIRGGANFSDLDIDGLNIFKTNTATGWFLGGAAEFMMPVIGLGLDASLMYSKVSSELQYTPAIDKDYKIHYLILPVNIKYKLGLPLVKPFIYAGPELCLRLCDNSKGIWKDLSLSDLDDLQRLRSRGADIKVNVGGGVELLDRLEIFFNYNVGLTNTIKHFDSKTKVWRVGATVFF